MRVHPLPEGVKSFVAIVCYSICKYRVCPHLSPGSSNCDCRICPLFAAKEFNPFVAFFCAMPATFRCLTLLSRIRSQGIYLAVRGHDDEAEVVSECNRRGVSIPRQSRLLRKSGLLGEMMGKCPRGERGHFSQTADEPHYFGGVYF